MQVVFYHRIISGMAVLLLLLVVCPSVYSQDLERIAPKTLQEQVPPAKVPELPVSQVLSSSPKRVLLEKLSGLIFLRAPEKVLKGGVRLEGILVDGYLPESFFKEMEAFLNQPLTLEDLNVILNKVVLYFRTQSTPVVDAYIPEQDITGGTVQVVVVEGRVGSIRAEGNRWFDSANIEKQVRTRPGEVIRGNALAEDVNWLNKNPFRHVDLVLARGEEKGQTDVILRTEDRFPLRVYGGYENSGNELTGRDRYLAGFNWGNAFGLGHLLDYQFTASETASRMQGHSLRYEIPLAWHDTLQFSAAYAESNPDLAPFDLNAESWQLSGRYVMDLPPVGLFRHELSLGVEYKFSNSNLEFSSEPVFDKKTEILQALLGYGGSMPDDWGRTAVHMQLVDSPGNILGHNDDAAFDDYQQGASAQYLYYTLDVDRLTALPRGFSWNVKAHLQLAEGPLLGSEQLGLGGYSSVRGFDERVVNGDQGYLLVNEIRTPSYDLSSMLNLPIKTGSLQFLGFWDYGLVRNRNDSADSILSSIGVGGRYGFGSKVSLRFDYGWQQTGRDLDSRVDSLGHVGLVIGY